MIPQAEQLLQRGPSVAISLLPAIFAIFDKWCLTGAQQMTLLGLSNEKTLYNWKGQPEKARLTRDLLERTSYILGSINPCRSCYPTRHWPISGWPLPMTIRCSMGWHRWTGCWRAGSGPGRGQEFP